ncbi:MAG: amino acid ABC transporter substrate-binding protein [Cyanobacteria bacterium J083]|nr:MAG: amino acid ABC transporter substrate-binding protein [Cyanobacteria bacterium J083]
MYKHILTGLFTLSALTFIAAPTLAETVMEKVKRTGILTAGTSRDALPFAYENEEGKLVGYSIDMLKLIEARLEQELNQEITLQLIAVAPKERIPSILKGKVDIVCDASSFTWERDKQIDFSVSYGITGTRLLVKKGTDLTTAESLKGKKIGALAKTTNEIAIKKAQPEAEIVLFPDRQTAYEAINRQEIDAFASDGILLEGWLQSIKNAEDYDILGYYSQEGIACMVPENNSKFLDNVNYSLVDFMQDFLEEEPEAMAIFDRWFGYNGIITLSQDLRDLVIESMRLVIEFKEPISDD